ncbi:MAG TPA: VTT domain-containing protein [Candidatus Paceibacterota bacterium]|jgi:membrane-associated protein|nr:VTT domain-containing protein [Candidatus Paceibacterota bacterium]
MFSFLNPQTLIAVFGLIGVIAIVFAETGLFFGFFLPGDSLLFTAGLLASEGHMPIALLLVGAFVAAVAGDSVGYAFGKKIGPAIFTKQDSIFFNKEHIARAQHFYEKHGKKTIILARFLPIIRTFAPIVAGVGTMPYRTFIAFNVIGGFLWTTGMIMIGYIFGSFIPDPDRYILPMIVVIIILSATPTLREIFRKRI